MIRSRDNSLAYDLRDHWNDPRVLEEGMGTSGLKRDEADARLDGLWPIVDALGRRSGGSRTLLRNVQAGSLAVVGERGGITYGQWRDGPAGTLHIEFDYRFAEELDDEQRARLERAGKSWSWRLADDFGAHAVEAGHWIASGGTVDGVALPELVLDEDVTTDGVMIFVDVHGGTRRSLGGWNGLNWSALDGDDFQPFAGVVRFGRSRFDEVESRGDFWLTSIMAHEIGHVMGIATLRGIPFYDAMVDEQAGNFIGANAVAENGGRPVPFQRLDGIDWAHLGPCDSVMSYCRTDAYGPTELDLAFLDDIGYEVLDSSVVNEPEVYGFGAWGKYSAWGAGVERTISYDEQRGGTDNLIERDRLRAGADAFGVVPDTDLNSGSMPQGTVSWSGSLIGVDIGSQKLPPVFGDAQLVVDLANLAGSARFSNLEVVVDGRIGVFGAGRLHYDIAVTGNSFSDSERRVTGGFFGPAHEEMAGVLRDNAPEVHLLAGFGGAR